MGVAKVTVNNVVKVDLTSDTVAADKLVSDYTAHGADGEAITGTYADSGGAVESDVNFYDYDGTLVKSYTAADFASLTAFPANPSHTGLTAQGWNWYLSDAKTYVATYGKLDIGQLYITDDAKTRFYITLSEPSQLGLGMNIAIKGRAFIDWGDGSSIESMSASSLTSQFSMSHTYSNLGDYIISVWPDTTANNEIGLCNTSDSLLFYNSDLSHTLSGSNVMRYCGILSILNKIECGRISTFNSYALMYCSNLKSITMSNSVYVIDSYAFAETGLEYIVIPWDVVFSEYSRRIFSNSYNLQGISFSYFPDEVNVGLGMYFCEGCCSLKHITIPHSCSYIDSYTFTQCRNLAYVVLPDSVTTISTYMFSYCYSLKHIITHNLSINTIPSGFCREGKSLKSFVIPDSTLTLSSYAFTYNKFTHVTIPEGVVTIQNNAFESSNYLVYVSIPSTVTNIQAYSFGYCYTMQEIHFKGTTPPTISNSNAFTNLNTKCKIYVPTGSLSAYTGATNYPSSSTYTYIEE